MPSGHGGNHAVAVARAHGIETMFTLSGAHVFPMYDAAVKGDQPMRLVDVRHEQTAVFAAEATAKLTRRPGLAVLTAGPGVTNGISAVTSAWFNGSPLLVVGGRAPAYRWGTGSLQELDHPPLLAPVTKRAATVGNVEQIATEVDDALRLASAPHRGPVFLDVPMDQLFSRTEVELPGEPGRDRQEPDADAVTSIAGLLASAQRPVLVIGSDVWSDGAEGAALRLAETAGVPVITNGMGRGILPAGHPLLVTRARSVAFGQADLVVVAGAPLDFRLGLRRPRTGPGRAALGLAGNCRAGSVRRVGDAAAERRAGQRGEGSPGPGERRRCDPSRPRLRRAAPTSRRRRGRDR